MDGHDTVSHCEGYLVLLQCIPKMVKRVNLLTVKTNIYRRIV